MKSTRDYTKYFKNNYMNQTNEDPDINMNMKYFISHDDDSSNLLHNKRNSTAISNLNESTNTYNSRIKSSKDNYLLLDENNVQNYEEDNNLIFKFERIDNYETKSFNQRQI